MEIDNYYESIQATSERIRSGNVSPVGLVQQCLQRIDRWNSSLNAFITVLSDQALQEAKIAEKEIKDGNWKGPLHGIPVGVKDMFDTAGIRTTAAFEYFINRIPAKDAVLVAKLKEAGAIVIGKTNMHKLAMGTTSVESHFGTVHNPWNQEYVAGGSSGGSAVAVSAGLCYATIDTDAVGSCRLPAACCGVVGFKATYGYLSSEGILAGEKADENILKVAHSAFMCRSVQDAAILLNSLAARQKEDYISIIDSALPNLRIGVVNNFQSTDEVNLSFQKAVETISSLGYVAQDIEAPLSPRFGSDQIDADRKNISASLFKDVDLLLLPTTADLVPTIQEAAKKGDMAVSADNTFFCNYYGLPAVSIPCGFSKNGLPLGLQIVGPSGGEENVLYLGNRFQQSTQWHLKHPNLG